MPPGAGPPALSVRNLIFTFFEPLTNAITIPAFLPTSPKAGSVADKITRMVFLTYIWYEKIPHPKPAKVN
jgi:hypothetical protein